MRFQPITLEVCMLSGALIVLILVLIKFIDFEFENVRFSEHTESRQAFDDHDL